MPNRFIFSLRFSSKVFLKLGMLSVALILFMSLFRMNLYFLSVFHATPGASFTEIGQSFLAGLRFDTLVFGFILIPVYFFVIAQALMEKWPRAMFVGYKLYFSMIWLVTCAMTFIDYFYFSKYGMRMRFNEYMSWTPETLQQQIAEMLPSQVWVFVVITILLFILGLMLIKGIRFGDWRDEFSPHKGSKFEYFWRLLVPLFLIALAARGTLEPHHLALEHSEVSYTKAINEMALNAVWCFDK